DGEARRRVADALARLDVRAMRDLGHARAQVRREAIAATLTGYYEPSGEYRPYKATCAGKTASTSILTRQGWLGLHVVLGHGHDHDAMALVTASANERLILDDETAAIAVRRVAEALATETRLINMPLYNLQHIGFTGGRMRGRVGLTDFLSYALTLDLLHRE